MLEKNIYKRCLEQFKYDLTKDWFSSIKWLLGLLIFVIADCIYTLFTIKNMKYGNIEYLGFKCYLWKILGGDYFVDLSSKDIKVPVEYIFIQILFLLLIVGYLKRDLKSTGYRNILCSGSKEVWLVSKYLLNILKSLIFFIVSMAGIFFAYFLEGNHYFEVNSKAFDDVLGYSDTSSSNIKLAVLVLIVNLIAISIIYTSLEYFFDNLYVLFIGCALIVVSYFIDSMFLFGNNLMLIRNILRIEEGKPFLDMIIPVCSLAIIMMMLSFLHIQKKDIL